PAVIVPASGAGIVLDNTAGIDIRGINVTGDRPIKPDTNGIQLFSSQPAGHRLKHVLVEGGDGRWRGEGISIGGPHPGAGFSHVVIGDSALHDNLDAGLASYGPAFNPGAPSYAHADLLINRVLVYRNDGDPRELHANTGNGIVLGSVSE